jgi:hypothetical protein
LSFALLAKSAVKLGYFNAKALKTVLHVAEKVVGKGFCNALGVGNAQKKGAW